MTSAMVDPVKPAIMYRFALVILLSGPPGTFAQDFLWFESTWISDTEATVLANPVFETLDAEHRQKFRALFGKTVWKISGGVLTATLEGREPYSTTYSITPVDDDSFNVFLDDNSRFRIFRTTTGFCAIPPDSGSGFRVEWVEPDMVECFRSVDDGAAPALRAAQRLRKPLGLIQKHMMGRIVG